MLLFARRRIVVTYNIWKIRVCCCDRVISPRMYPVPLELQKRPAKYMVLQCFRNSLLEDLHSGITPSSVVGDYSDVYVRSIRRDSLAQAVKAK
jgi:hypothetical protein